MRYLFIYCCLFLAPLCRAISPSVGTAGSTNASPGASSEKGSPILPRLRRTVYLHFNVYAGHAFRRPRAYATVLLSNEAGPASTTTALNLGAAPYGGSLPRMEAAYMIEDMRAIPPLVLSRIGIPLQVDPQLTTVTLKLGITSLRNVDIIHPETGAGVWVNALASNPRISPTNLYSSVIVRLLGLLNIVSDHVGDGTFGGLHHAEFELMRQCFQHVNEYQLTGNSFSTFPVMALIHRQGHGNDEVYNIADLRNPRRIPASPNNHLAISTFQELTRNPGHNSAGPSNAAAPQGPAMRHQVLAPGRFGTSAQSHGQSGVTSDTSGEGSVSGRQQSGSQEPQAGPSRSRFGP